MTTHTDHHVELLAQADLLLLAARLLGPPWKLPGDAFDLSAEDVEQLTERAGAEHDSPLRLILQNLMHDAATLDADEWADEHNRLFEGSIVCPINETAYVRRDKGAILADIQGFCGAFGFAIAPDAGEKADHMVGELELVAMLLVMLADARRRADDEAIQVTEQALHAFAANHIGEWLCAFCDRLRQTARLPLYRHAADLLEQTWQTITGRLSLPAPEASAVDPPTDDDGTPYECDMTDASPTIDVSVRGTPMMRPQP